MDCATPLGFIRLVELVARFGAIGRRFNAPVGVANVIATASDKCSPPFVVSQPMPSIDPAINHARVLPRATCLVKIDETNLRRLEINFFVHRNLARTTRIRRHSRNRNVGS